MGTIMLRKLPLTYTRTMLLDLLDSEDDAEFARQRFQGFNQWATEDEEVCETSWSDPYQGLAANVERYRNSPVMHESVDDEHKPVVFFGGVRQAFPPPTKLIKAPKTVHRSIPLSTSTRMSGA